LLTEKMNAVFKTVVTALLDAILFIVYLVDFIPELFLSEREKQNRKKRLAKMVTTITSFYL
jgi:hypothetical protein